MGKLESGGLLFLDDLGDFRVFAHSELRVATGELDLSVALGVLGLRFHEKANERRHLEIAMVFSKRFYLSSREFVRFNSRLLPEGHFRDLVVLVGDENVADAGSGALDGAHVSDVEDDKVGVSEENSFLRNRDQPSSLSGSEVEEVGESGRRTGLDLRIAESRSLTFLGVAAELRRRHIGERSGSSALDGSRRVGHDELLNGSREREQPMRMKK